MNFSSFTMKFNYLKTCMNEIFKQRDIWTHLCLSIRRLSPFSFVSDSNHERHLTVFLGRREQPLEGTPFSFVDMSHRETRRWLSRATEKNRNRHFVAGEERRKTEKKKKRRNNAMSRDTTVPLSNDKKPCGHKGPCLRSLN